MENFKKMKIVMIILSFTILSGCIAGRLGNKGEDGKDGEDGKAYVMIDIPGNAMDVDFDDWYFIDDYSGIIIRPNVYYEADPGTYSGTFYLTDTNGIEHPYYYYFRISIEEGEKGEEGTYGLFGEDGEDGDDGKDGEDRYYHLDCYWGGLSYYYNYDD